MRIYIAGPMTNLPDHNLPAFADAAERLTKAGFDTVNPGRHGVIPGYVWTDYLRRALTEMLTCDAVALLPDWAESRGAALEVYVAKQLDMPIMALPEWLQAREAVS